MRQYQDIIFLDNSNADEALDILSEDADAAIDYLLQWDYGDGPVRYEPPWGESDKLIRRDDLILTYNLHLDYISLTREVEE